MITNVDKKMRASFNAAEKKLLQGQSNKLAQKHGCSRVYVRFIIQGERDINTELAKKIYEDLLKLIDLLGGTPNSQ